MWVRCQYKKDDDGYYVNDSLNLCRYDGIRLDITGNVGRIYVLMDDIAQKTLGEYRDYAARKIFHEITLLAEQDSVYLMPDECEANERYKED